MLLDLGKGSSRCPRLVNMWYKGAVRWRSAASARGHWVARARSLREFQTSFAAETSCAAFLFERRWPQGFVCPACGAGRAALLRSRAHTYECLDCGRQTSITAGTVMHRSKLPLTVWFWAAHLMATHSNGMSAVQLEAQRRVASYARRRSISDDCGVGCSIGSTRAGSSTCVSTFFVIRLGAWK